MEEEKKGVLKLNKEDHEEFNKLKEEQEQLLKQKNDVLSRDQQLSKKYNFHFNSLKDLEDTQKKYQKTIEELDWKTCLLNNEV